MNKVNLWAPEKKEVILISGDQKIAMTKNANGHWLASDFVQTENEDYAFLVDGEGPFPDPRSLWQPKGIYGPSRWVDHSKFPWEDHHWKGMPLTSSNIIYELHTGTFTPEGTFEALEKKLDYLLELGIDAIELMPVNGFSGNRGWGYDGVNLFAVYSPYGGPTALKKLINSAHKKGIAVILDVVYNHLGPDGNFLGKFAPYFTDKYKTPWGAAINYDSAHSDEVRKFIIDNALMWLRDYHFDGLRLDAVHAIVDNSATHILEEIHIEVDKLKKTTGKEYFLIAESDLNDPRLITSQAEGGFGLDAQWSDDFHHAIHSSLTGEVGGYYEDFGELSQIAKAYQNSYVYDGIYSKHRKRRHGRQHLKTSGKHFLSYIQNHDQIGNRAKGDRINSLISINRLKIASALNILSPFVAMLFQGEEWAASSPFQFFCHHQDPAIAEATRKGRISEFMSFGWKKDEIPDPQNESTFLNSKLDWEEKNQNYHLEIQSWYKELIKIRKTFLKDNLGEIQAQYDQINDTIRIRSSELMILINLSEQNQELELPKHSNILLSSIVNLTHRAETVTLIKDSVVIIGLK